MQSLLHKLRIAANNLGACTGPDQWFANGSTLESRSPIDDSVIATVKMATVEDYDRVSQASLDAFRRWREIPAPKRGQLIRDLGESLRRYREPLGELVTLEMGKILAEGIGEVQEMIDICDFAVGLSRQLCGNTMHSERPGHRMYEQWHPLGPIGIISAFNFPVAVWSWNAALAAVCGNTMIWKPSPLTPLTAVAVQHLCNDVAAQHGQPGLFNLVIGDNQQVAPHMIEDRNLPLISFTGSSRIGKQVAEVVSRRFGKSLLELGGNNALIVEPDADLDMALRAILFGAVGTAGQRCTTTRRLLVQHSILPKLLDRLKKAYEQVEIGNPLHPGTLMGPLIHGQAVEAMMRSIEQAVSQGGRIVVGGQRIVIGNGHYVQPTILEMPSQTPQVHEETFAPILYVMGYETLDEAIAMQNAVPQGLSSALFTNSLRAAERFLSTVGSDCGIANINIGTSGAEIGGAFGGEKETGGGRESGSDAWKTYMRRQTNTINWSNALPLAQGIQFGDN